LLPSRTWQQNLAVVIGCCSLRKAAAANLRAAAEESMRVRMKVSGPIRRTERKTSRTVARRNSSPRFAFPPGAAHSGPDAHHSGPGSFCRVGPVELQRPEPAPKAAAEELVFKHEPLPQRLKPHSPQGNSCSGEALRHPKPRAESMAARNNEEQFP
jgi:hypothetical protein